MKQEEHDDLTLLEHCLIRLEKKHEGDAYICQSIQKIRKYKTIIEHELREAK